MKPERLANPIPQPVIDAIKATPKHSDVFSVVKDTRFAGQILKVDTITFASLADLTLEATNVPWLAIVAKTIKVAAPIERFTISIPTDKIIYRKAPSIPKASPLPKASNGGEAANGTNGYTGSFGLPGNTGFLATKVPMLFIIAGSIVTQSGNTKPDFLDMMIKSPGIDGGQGGDGQEGQDGQAGGDGGPADWHDPISYPTDPGCKAGAGYGGRGGDGGIGGPGGAGGNASDGGSVIYAGSEAAIDLLEFAKVYNLGGEGGYGGDGGRNGNGGWGGARGEHKGGCGGGGDGAGGNKPTARSNSGAKGADGARGQIFTQIINVATLY